MSKLLTLLLIVLVGSCSTQANDPKPEIAGSNDGVVETVEILDTLAFCEQLVPRKCLQIKREGKARFTTLYDEIENFKFIAGYQYVLKIEVTKVRNPPKDTSGTKYRLIEVVSRTKVENPDPLANLYLSKWKLVTIKGESIQNKRAFLVFRKHKKNIYGNTGCNSIRGEFTLNGNIVGFSRLSQTKRACPDSNTVELPFTGLLGGDLEVEAQIDRLYFKKDGAVVLEFKSNWE